MYAGEGSLLAVPVDAGRLEVTGEPVLVLEDVLTRSSGDATFSFSENGSLVYAPGGATGGRTLGWVNREGQMTPLIEDTASSVRLSVGVGRHASTWRG